MKTLLSLLLWSALPGVSAEFTCSADAPSKPKIRAEGLAELVGDLVLLCSGPAPPAPLTAAIFFNSNLTSRLVDDRTSEALVVVEKPGDPFNPQQLRLGQNAFRGTMFGPNAIVWAAVPVGTEYRTPSGEVYVQLRITNVRVSANMLGASSTGPVMITLFALVGSGDKTLAKLQAPVAVLVSSVRTTVQFCTGESAPALRFLQNVGQNEDLASGRRPSGKLHLNIRWTEPADMPDAFLPSEESLKRQPPLNPLVSKSDSAEQGTRLAVRFQNVPQGMRLFVTTQASPFGRSGRLDAKLVSTDMNGSGAYVPAAKGATAECGGRRLAVAPLEVLNGSAMAVWEVTASDSERREEVSFGVAFAYEPGPLERRPSLGTTVYTSTYAPFSTVASANRTAPIPRFADISTSRSLFSVEPARVYLLFPKVSNQAGFDTQLAIRNTSQKSSGSCKLHYSGSTAGGGSAPGPQDTAPLEPGQRLTFTLSKGGEGVQATPGFQGCVLAECFVPSAQGEAALINIGNGQREPPIAAVAAEISDPAAIKQLASQPGCSISNLLPVTP